MKEFEKTEALQRLNERQMYLQSVMAKSDSHAAKCVKLGKDFAEEYPNEYAEYTAAREEYNSNEEKIAELNAAEVEEEHAPEWNQE